MTELIIGLRRPETLEKIELAIADHAMISLADLREGGRDRAFAEARQYVWTLAHLYLRMPYIKIARLYGKDHTTVIHGVAKIRESGRIEEAREIVNKRFPALLPPVQNVGETLLARGGRRVDGKSGR